MEMVKTNYFTEISTYEMQKIDGGAWYNWVAGTVCGIVGLIGGGLSGAVAGAGVGTVTIPIVGTFPGATVGFIGGACTGAVAGFCAGYALFS